MKNINKTPFVENYLIEFDEVEEIKTILNNYSYKKIFSNDIFGNIENEKYKKYNSIVYDSYSDFSDDFIGDVVPKNVMLILKLYGDGQQYYETHGAKKEADIFKKNLLKINNYYEKKILRNIKFGIILNINYSNRFIRNLVRMNTLETFNISYFYSDFLKYEKVYQDINTDKENIKIFGYLPSSLRLLDVNFSHVKYSHTKRSSEKFSNSINNIWLPNKIGIFKSTLNAPSYTKKIKYPFNTFNIITGDEKESKMNYLKKNNFGDNYELVSEFLSASSFIKEDTFNLLTDKFINNNKFAIVQINCCKVINKSEKYHGEFNIIGGEKNHVGNINKTSVNFIKLISDLHISYSQSNYVKGILKENILEHENKFDKFYWNLISDTLPNVEVNNTGLGSIVTINAVFKNYPYDKDLIKSYKKFTEYEHDKNFYYSVIEKVFTQLLNQS